LLLLDLGMIHTCRSSSSPLRRSPHLFLRGIRVTKNDLVQLIELLILVAVISRLTRRRSFLLDFLDIIHLGREERYLLH